MTDAKLTVIITNGNLQHKANTKAFDPEAIYCSTSGWIRRGDVVVRMPAMPRRIFLALVANSPGLVSSGDLYDLVFAESPDGGPETSLSPLVSYARDAAAALGIAIEIHKGRGWLARPLRRLHAVVLEPAA